MPQEEEWLLCILFVPRSWCFPTKCRGRKYSASTKWRQKRTSHFSGAELHSQAPCFFFSQDPFYKVLIVQLVLPPLGFPNIRRSGSSCSYYLKPWQKAPVWHKNISLTLKKWVLSSSEFELATRPNRRWVGVFPLCSCPHSQDKQSSFMGVSGLGVKNAAWRGTH